MDVKVYKIFFPKDRNSGFTLLELLIAIAVIGFLAAVILIAIDPIEMINRAKDAGAKAEAAQLFKAAAAALASQGYVIDPDSSFGGQQPLVKLGELKSILKNGYNDGPYYYSNVNRVWVDPGDFEVTSGSLYSKSTLQAAKAQPDASSQNCGPGSTYADFYSYYSSGGKWHYWCDHP